MNFIDLSTSSRISGLMELTRALRGCRTPFDALLMYSKYLGTAYPNRAQLILSTRGLAAGEYRVWRLRDDSGTEHLELTNPWLSLDQPVLRGGVIARVIENETPRLAHHIDWSADPHFANLLSPYHWQQYT